jgi:hypothetical protein
MAGLVPAIHALLAAMREDVDARDERGHDASVVQRLAMTRFEDLPYRPCVGVMVLNRDGLAFIGRRTTAPPSWSWDWRKAARNPPSFVMPVLVPGIHVLLTLLR